MTPQELTKLGEQAFGRSWKSILATELGVYVSTVNRWVTGFTPISRKNEHAIRRLIELQTEKEVA